MRIVVVRIALVALACAAAAVGCRAAPRVGYVPPDGNGIDMSLLPPDDMAVPPEKCPQLAVEDCTNGCDDDRNGYADADDPQCTTQMLVTFAISPSMTAPLTRMTLGSAGPKLDMLDGNPLTSGAMATLHRRQLPAYYVALDGAGKSLTKVVPDLGSLQANDLNMITRDVCIFNGEVIVVEPIASGDTPVGGRLHRFESDAKTELMPSVPVQGQLTACSSDGVSLYVARSISGGASELVVLAKGVGGGAPTIVGAPIALPPSIVASTSCCSSGTNCCNRLLDFAWIKHTNNFVGLFAAASSTPDAVNDSPFVAEFALDGGAGGFVDAGRWHGLGDFVP